MTGLLSLRKPIVAGQWAALAALLLGGCTSASDQAFTENSIRQMLGQSAAVPLPSDLPKVGDSDWCARVNLVLDNSKVSAESRNQYLAIGREKHCDRALAAQ